MPSSLLPSRSAFSSESISATSLFFISSKFWRRSLRNFFRFAGVFFVGIAITPSVYARTRHYRMEIVAERPLDLRADEIPRLGVSLEHHHAIDFGRLRWSSPAKPRGAPRRRALDHHLVLAADEVAILLQRNFRLHFHQGRPAFALEPLGDLPRQGEGV